MRRTTSDIDDRCGITLSTSGAEREVAAHRLDPLLRPDTVAIVGASSRPDSAGGILMRQILAAGWSGTLLPVNPRYPEIRGLECFLSLDRLPLRPDLVIFAIGADRIEAELERAIAIGARAAVLYSSLYVDGADPGALVARLRRRAREAGLIVCGGNGMGFYNFETGLWACAFPTRPNHRAGGIALVTHSGSVFNSLLDAEERLDFNLAVSPGQELTATVADYLDYALELPTTRVVGLVLEAVRDPAAFTAALIKAAERRIPVVALKLGRTAASAVAAESHSGALTGSHDAYRALFDRYGVAEVATIDELAYALMLFAHAWPVGPGGLATIHDSGGERELMIDLAAEHGVPMPALTPETTARLAERLEPGLLPINPLDAWGTGRDNEAVFGGGFAALVADPNIAIGAVACDRTVQGAIDPAYRRYLEAARDETGKPVCLVSSHQGSGIDPEAVALTRDGMPVIDGVAPFLVGVRALFRFRDFKWALPPACDQCALAAAEIWRPALREGRVIGEGEALRMLAAFGIPVVPSEAVESVEAAIATAAQFGYPVVLKTAAPGIAHKTDVGGVLLDLDDEAALRRGFTSLVARFGLPVRVAPMITGGVEMLLGVTQDPEFGPLVTLGFGGIHAEILRDVVTLLPPFRPEAARAALDRLRLRRLLDGARGAPPAAIDAFCLAASRLSMLAAVLGNDLGELDVNPVSVTQSRAVALDAIVVPIKSPPRRSVEETDE